MNEVAQTTSTTPDTGRRAPGELLRIWQRLSRVPAGSWIFSRALRLKVPYSGSIRAQVLELSPGHARVRMRDRRRVRNHLRSVHAVALLNLAELSSGLAMIAGLSDRTRAILTGLSMDYVKKARGPITAECRCQVDEPRETEEVQIEVHLTDAAGDRVATGHARWRIGPKPG